MLTFHVVISDERDKKSLGGETDAEETVPLQAAAAGVSAVSSTMGEQTTLVHNEEEAFALEPLDITTVPGMLLFLSWPKSFLVQYITTHARTLE